MSESNTQSGRDKIQQVLGVCEPLTTPQAAQVFCSRVNQYFYLSPSRFAAGQATYGWLVNGLETMVQYGYPVSVRLSPSLFSFLLARYRLKNRVC